MARNTAIALSDHFTNFIEGRVATGHYGSASEVIRAGLRLLEEHESRLERLRQALIEGENSGEPEPFDMKQWLAEQRDLDTTAA